MARGDKGTKRRDSIVDEATRLFAERGYEGASMADLAERVGLRKASLFHHFPSKEQLYAAVLERPVRDVRDAMENASKATDGSFDQRLDALSDALVGVLGAQPYAARLLVREAIESSTSTAIDGVFTAAEQFLEEKSAVDGSDLRQMVMSIVGVCFMPFTVSAVVQRYVGGDPFSGANLDARKRAVRGHVRNLCKRA
jgi:AcrR family transcriptional regulator